MRYVVLELCRREKLNITQMHSARLTAHTYKHVRRFHSPRVTMAHTSPAVVTTLSLDLVTSLPV